LPIIILHHLEVEGFHQAGFLEHDAVPDRPHVDAIGVAPHAQLGVLADALILCTTNSSKYARISIHTVRKRRHEKKKKEVHWKQLGLLHASIHHMRIKTIKCIRCAPFILLVITNILIHLAPNPPIPPHLFDDFRDALEGGAVLLVFVVAQSHVVLEVGLVAQVGERVAVLGAGRVVRRRFLHRVRLARGGGVVTAGLKKKKEKKKTERKEGRKKGRVDKRGKEKRIEEQGRSCEAGSRDVRDFHWPLVYSYYATTRMYTHCTCKPASLNKMAALLMTTSGSSGKHCSRSDLQGANSSASYLMAACFRVMRRMNTMALVTITTEKAPIEMARNKYT